MDGSQNMIESSESSRDRLSIFFRLFSLSVTPLLPSAGEAANLVVGRHRDDGACLALGQHALGVMTEVRAAARVDFEGAVNPLVRAMPDPLLVPLSQAPALRAVADSFVAEVAGSRCGAPLATDYLGRLLLLMALRHAVETGAADAGLLAGLAHPNVYPALVAMHEQPGRNWQVGDLAVLGGVSRTRFMGLFTAIVGTTPIAYLNGWRLALGRRELERGGRIKAVARHVGYGSAAAFSRAYARHFGSAPLGARAAAGPAVASTLTRAAPHATPRE